MMLSTSRKIALFALLFGTSTCSLAAIYPSAFNGYYVGAMIGALETQSKISANATSTYSNFFDDANQLAYSQSGVKVNDYSGVGALYLGYGQFVSCNFFLAGEIFANWANRKNTLNNWAYHIQPNDDLDYESLSAKTTMKLNQFEYGLDIRPGFMMDTNTLLYGRIGVAFNRVKNDTNNTFSFTDTRPVTPQTYNSLLSQSKSKNRTSLRLGLGLERKMTDCLAITADYIYTWYGKASTSGIGNTTSVTDGDDASIAVTNFNGLQASSSGTMNTQAAMLGIKYYFYPVA